MRVAEGSAFAGGSTAAGGDPIVEVSEETRGSGASGDNARPVRFSDMLPAQLGVGGRLARR